MQLVSNISNLCGPDPPTLQTDRQAHGWADIMQSRGKNQGALKVKAYAVLRINKNLYIHRNLTNLLLLTRKTLRLKAMPSFVIQNIPRWMMDAHDAIFMIGYCFA